MSDKIPKSFDSASREAYAAGEAWRLFRIMSEFVEATERMNDIRPTVKHNFPPAARAPLSARSRGGAAVSARLALQGNFRVMFRRILALSFLAVALPLAAQQPPIFVLMPRRPP